MSFIKFNVTSTWPFISLFFTLQMNRSSKTRSSNYYSNTQLQAPNRNVGEVEHRSIEQSFTEDEVKSEAQPAFQAKNSFYELQSKCNNLQYQKIKSDMAYKNIVSQLRSKNSYLEQLASTHAYNNQILAEERDKVLIILSEVRQQNYQLAKKIEAFKREVTKLENLRGNGEQIQQSHLLQQLQDRQDEIMTKDQKIASLQNQLARMEFQTQQMPNQSANILKKQINNLEKELQTLKNELEEAQKSQQSLKLYERQKEELMTQLKLKDSQIQQLKEEKQKLENQIQRVRDNAALRQRRASAAHNQQIKRLSQLIKTKEFLLQESQNSKVVLESKVTELTVETGRLKSQNSGLDQYNKYLQSCNTQIQQKRKTLQQQIYRFQKQNQQLRSNLFNQKLQNKKILGNIRLTLEQEKNKYAQLMQEKSRQIMKLREDLRQSLGKSRMLKNIANEC